MYLGSHKVLQSTHGATRGFYHDSKTLVGIGELLPCIGKVSIFGTSDYGEERHCRPVIIHFSSASLPMVPGACAVMQFSPSSRGAYALGRTASPYVQAKDRYHYPQISTRQGDVIQCMLSRQGSPGRVTLGTPQSSSRRSQAMVRDASASSNSLNRPVLGYCYG